MLKKVTKRERNKEARAGEVGSFERGNEQQRTLPNFRRAKSRPFSFFVLLYQLHHHHTPPSRRSAPSICTIILLLIRQIRFGVDQTIKTGVLSRRNSSVAHSKVYGGRSSDGGRARKQATVLDQSTRQSANSVQFIRSSPTHLDCSVFSPATLSSLIAPAERFGSIADRL
jgi:hypothetical protein